MIFFTIDYIKENFLSCQMKFAFNGNSLSVSVPRVACACHCEKAIADEAKLYNAVKDINVAAGL